MSSKGSYQRGKVRAPKNIKCTRSFGFVPVRARCILHLVAFIAVPVKGGILELEDSDAMLGLIRRFNALMKPTGWKILTKKQIAYLEKYLNDHDLQPWFGESGDSRYRSW